MSILGKVKRKLERDGVSATLLAILRSPRRLKRKLEYQRLLKKESLSERFEEIYEKNHWSSAESRSGAGSELDFTKALRKWLVARLPELDVKTMVDAPCGDFNWMKTVVPEVEVAYLGLDIVEGIIRDNNAHYGSDRISFAVADICKDRVPDCDFLMVRDCLFHLSFADIDRFLQNINNTNYRYLLTTTHIVEDDEHINKDIQSGSFRLIDLFAHPFGFDEAHVTDRIDDYPEGYGNAREMILVEKKHVPTALARPFTLAE